MTEKPFSVNDALRHARHDFLNQMQLIKMNMDLARLDEAREVIASYTEKCKVFYELSKLQLPKTSEWLQTANWRFPGFQVEVGTEITMPYKTELDISIRDSLELFTKFLEPKLNPYFEHELRVWIESTENVFILTVEANGKWELGDDFLMKTQGLTITHECKTTEKWRFHIEESKEG